MTRSITEFAETARILAATERCKAAAAGEALPDGSFPIRSRKDLHNAVEAYGRARNKATAKRHIKKRAEALGLTAMLPEAWSTGSVQASVEMALAVPGSDETPKTEIEEELEVVNRSPEYFEAQFRDLDRCRAIMAPNLKPLQDRWYTFLSNQNDAIHAIANLTVDLVESFPLSHPDVVEFLNGLEDACGRFGVPLSNDLADYRRDIVGY